MDCFNCRIFEVLKWGQKFGTAKQVRGTSGAGSRHRTHLGTESMWFQTRPPREGQRSTLCKPLAGVPFGFWGSLLVHPLGLLGPGIGRGLPGLALRGHPGGVCSGSTALPLLAAMAVQNWMASKWPLAWGHLPFSFLEIKLKAQMIYQLGGLG